MGANRQFVQPRQVRGLSGTNSDARAHLAEKLIATAAEHARGRLATPALCIELTALAGLSCDDAWAELWPVDRLGRVLRGEHQHVRQLSCDLGALEHVVVD